MTRAIPGMRDKHDHVTLGLLLEPAAAPVLPCPAKCKPGRPREPDALSDAERARRYRARKKTRLAELRDETVPVSSTVMDLSALPPWKRRAA